MVNYNLEYDENIILAKDNVAVGFTGLKRCSLALTNKNLIIVWYYFLWPSKNIEKHELSTIKMYQGKPQVRASRSRGGLPSLEVYFIDSQMEFQFTNSFLKTGAQEFVYEITKLLANDSSYFDNSDADVFALSGTTTFAKTLKGTVNVFKKNIAANSTVAYECPHCGASIAGMKGESVICKYCGSHNNL